MDSCRARGHFTPCLFMIYPFGIDVDFSCFYSIDLQLNILILVSSLFSAGDRIGFGHCVILYNCYI